MLKIDLHIHSIASGHSFNTIFELAAEAAKKDIKCIGIVDHGPSMEGAPHVGYFEMLYKVPKKINGVRVITGCECNIINIDGELDLPVNPRNNLNLVMAGLHKKTPYPENTTVNQNTKAITNAIERNKMHIIVHPYRPEFPIDIKVVMDTARKYNVLMEVNLSLFSRPNISNNFLEQVRLMIKMVQENNQKLIVGTDSHIATNIGDDSILKKFDLNIPPDLILGNKGNYKEVEKFLNLK